MTDQEVKNLWELPRVEPFNGRNNWSGKLWTLDDTPIHDFTREDLDKILWSYDSGDRWDGEVACICLLKDGRYISWETSYGPTGDGFSKDAYGGDADILCSASFEQAMEMGLTPERRKNAVPVFLERASIEVINAYLCHPDEDIRDIAKKIKDQRNETHSNIHETTAG